MRSRPLAFALGLALLLLVPGPAGARPDAEGNLEWSPDLDEADREFCEEAERLWERAQAQPSPENLEAAIDALRRAARRARRSPIPPYYLGIAYQYTQEYGRAERSLRRAIRLEPEFHEAEVELADNHTHEEEWDDAARHYERAIELAPDYAVAYKRRAMLLHVKRGHFEEALADLDRAAEIHPDDPEIERRREQIERAVNGPDWEEAFEATSEHYRVRTNVSQDFADFIAHRAELIHRLYESIFPEVDDGDRLYPIIVYGRREEYHEHGGPENAGGHYSPRFRSLELFRYENRRDTLIVLHHEGFHQFMHTQLDDAPQWFDEGLGDFFGPSEYVEEDGREMYRVRPNPWRLRTIQQALRARATPPVPRLMTMTQREMYSGNQGLHYAMAWSLVYFCCEARDRDGDLTWFPALKAYFDALRAGRDRFEAYSRSFGRVDMDRFEREWRSFILDVEAGG